MSRKSQKSSIPYDLQDWFIPCNEVNNHFNDIKSDLAILKNLEGKLELHIQTLDPKLLKIRRNLLLALRCNELFKVLFVIRSCIRFGFYDAVFRELRYALDIVLQAYYIDQNHLDLDIWAKVAIQEALENWRGFMGNQLIKKTNLKGFKRDIKDMYSELSKYVHGSFSELRPKLQQIKVDDSLSKALRIPRFDKSMVKTCVELTKKTLALIFQINLHFEKWFMNI